MNQFIDIPEGKVGIVWFEQSHFSLRTADGPLVHVDPYLSRTVSPENFIHAKPLVEPGEAVADLVFLTHDHGDHTDPDTLVPIAKNRPHCRFFGSEDSRKRCLEAGIDETRLVRIAAGDRFEESGVEVIATYAEKTGDEDDTPHLGFILRFSSTATSIYITGDTRPGIDVYRSKLRSVAGLRPEVLIVPINEGYNNPGPGGASEIVEYVDPKVIVPCHYGCFKNNTIDPERFLGILPEVYRGRTRLLDRGGHLIV